ncbi:MAG: hypothetical protein ACYTFW_12250 [Planctomycetota bacterium]
MNLQIAVKLARLSPISPKLSVASATGVSFVITCLRIRWQNSLRWTQHRKKNIEH